MSEYSWLGGTFLAILAALILDHLLGEPRRWHPLAGFGQLAGKLETLLNHGNPRRRLLAGLAGWLALALPLALLAEAARPEGPLQILWDAVIVYACIGLRSLKDHTRPIAEALQTLARATPGQAPAALADARARTAMIVSRDTDSLDADQCARAATESLLENGNDALFATLFWYALLGPAGAILHRAANTLDAMWGYRTERFEHFGKFAAHADDLLAWLPARLTALSYAVTGNAVTALRCWRTQASRLASPNGGPTMCSGAGSLGVTLGGPARYHGQWKDKPWFGDGPAPTGADILRAQALLHRSLILWLPALALLLPWSTS